MKNFKLILIVAICYVLFAANNNLGYDVGDWVSDFKLKNVDGKYISLSDYKNAKGVIIVFDCNTCPYSKAYNERIIELNKKYKSNGFPLLAINSNDSKKSAGDSFDEMIAHAKRDNYSFPYLIDETQSVARAFGASNTPHVFILYNHPEGFKVSYIGAIDNNVRDASAADKKYVQEAVDALLDGKAISIPKTKAIGCGIKWKDS